MTIQSTPLTVFLIYQPFSANSQSVIHHITLFHLEFQVKDNHKKYKISGNNQTKLSYYQFEQGRKYLEKVKSVDINDEIMLWPCLEVFFVKDVNFTKIIYDRFLKNPCQDYLWKLKPELIKIHLRMESLARLVQQVQFLNKNWQKSAWYGIVGRTE